MSNLKFLLIPFSLFYGVILLLRVGFYKFGFFPFFKPPIPTIIVGNLSMGGTGKTPHVEFLIRAMQNQYKIAVLSRGYGRATKGFRQVQLNSPTSDVGDEPKQIKQKFPDIPFAVCEKRKVGIQELLKLYPDLQLIILDDAMQHLAVSVGFTLMLSEFKRPFFKDWLVPMGRLREFAWSGKKRADVCVYTKCPEIIDSQTEQIYAHAFSSEKPTYFSRFVYGDWKMISKKEAPTLVKQVILVTGIANPQPLVNSLKSNFAVELMSFADHHAYDEKDIDRIHHIFANFDASTTVVLTTEKDAVKLGEMSSIAEQERIPWMYVPIEVELENEKDLLNRIDHYVKTYSRGS